MRKAIGEIPDGTYRHEIFIDGFDDPIKVAIAVTISGSDLHVDFAGTSPQINRGINVPFAYCVAYTAYPLKCAIPPHIPNNEGSFRPVRISAPEACILNCQFPAPAGGRHIIGHFLSTAVFDALAQVIPDRVMADGSANIWITQIIGETDPGRQFAYFFSRPAAPGLAPTRIGSRRRPSRAASAACRRRSSRTSQHSSCASGSWFETPEGRGNSAGPWARR